MLTQFSCSQQTVLPYIHLFLRDKGFTGQVEKAIMKSDYSTLCRGLTVLQPVMATLADDLSQAYVEVRHAGVDARSNDRRITATTHQLESMIRLSKAHVRIRYSESVDIEDVTEPNRLIREALRESALLLSSAEFSNITDPLTGLIDLDLLSGQSTRQRKIRGDLRREIVALLSSTSTALSKGMRWSELAKQLEAQSSLTIDNSELSDVIRALETEGSVRVTGAAHFRNVKLVGNAQQVEV
ncbi:hypothetical protein JCM11251_000784 [Rhodosporidiobolus azoricus]